jgi:hypothetical protein
MKKIIFLLVIMANCSIAVHANDVLPEQTTDSFGDDGEGPPVEDPPPPAPIDQWIPILMLGGMAFVGYKTLRSKHKSDQVS